jgi:PAS domain S-box-containing protein
VNLNSLISRAGMSTGPQLMDQQGLNEIELKNVVKIMGFPALLLNKLGMIVDVNPQFEALTGYSSVVLLQKNLSALPDQALQKNLQELIKKSQSQSQITARDQIEMASMMLSIQCQSLGTPNGGSEFYLISFAPLTESQGGAA